MKIFRHACLLLLSGFFTACSSEAQPTVETFKEAFVKKLKALQPEGYEKRTVKLVSVTKGATNGGATSFKVTAYIHDYDEGYPSNNFYGETCVGKIDNWTYTLLKDGTGEWIVQGKFTVTDNNCIKNPSQGVESQPVSAVPGTVYEVGKKQAAGNTPATNNKNANTLYIGEYAAYGTGGRMMTGMGIILTADKKYYDLDKQRGGTYSYNQKAGTITFTGGFLDGKVGKNVNATGFDISETVHYEPWR